jgi:hypothetical protein
VASRPGSSPVAEAHLDIAVIAEHIDLTGVGLHPIEGAALILESPRLNDPKSVGECRPARPKKENAVAGGEITDGKRGDFVDRHCVVVRRAALSLGRPRCVGVWRIAEDRAEVIPREVCDRLLAYVGRRSVAEEG